MSLILSIQSHVAYGYVGNKAAVFPLQCMGYDVVDINTVQFSNHTGYGTWTGQVFPAEHIQDVMAGIRERGVLQNIKTVISGYMGSAELGKIVLEAVREIRHLAPDAVYCCDPVMGDTGRGFFVREGIPSFFRDEALKSATIITPNQFELSWLTGISIKTLEDAREACRRAMEMGPEIVLLTSLEHDATPSGHIQMLAMSANQAFTVTTPKLDLQVNGSGDCTAALFLGNYLESRDLGQSLSLTADGIFHVFEKTRELNSREIALIQAQNGFRIKNSRFKAEICA